MVAQNVVSYVTVIDVPNQALKLKPGMTANVTVEIARADDVLRVPNAALRFRPEDAAAGTDASASARPVPARRLVLKRVLAPVPLPQRRAGGGAGARTRRPHVFILQNGQLQPVAVETGITDGTTTAIIGGDLADNAQVITGMAVASTGAAQPSTSPLLPFGNRAGRGGTRGARHDGSGQRTGAGR